MESRNLNAPIKKTVRTLVIIALLMFGFTFALIPLYTVFCDVTGLNGKLNGNTNPTVSRYRVDPTQIRDRLVTIEFDVNKSTHLPCIISPQHRALRIKPGALTITTYQVKNLSDKTLIVRAVPSISPGIVAKHLKKLECFCFSEQRIGPNEIASLPLKFWLEPEFPDSVHRLTLSYTLFEVRK